MPVILASFNYGRYALPISCALWLAMPFLMLGWYVVQIRAIVSGDRTPLWLLGLVIAFSFLPGLFAYSWLTAQGKVSIIDTSAGWVSLGGLAMLPLTLVLEGLKRWRDLKLTALERRKRKM